jgi:ADP-ribose pyrophosphatase YjhB (NUDIX family)
MKEFNIRVYGLLINAENHLLLSDELIRGEKITKFPGGGLEIGEGTRDCLIREFMEELNLPIAVGEHFYTTDFYQQSAFNPAHQIISIYYMVQALEPIQVDLKSQPFDFDTEAMKKYEASNETEVFRFINLHKNIEQELTLPIDKLVVNMLVSRIG